MTFVLTGVGFAFSGPLAGSICFFAAGVVAVILWTPVGHWLGFSSEADGPGVADKSGAIRDLKLLATENSEAKIIVFPIDQVPLGREIASIFELADWGVNFIETPQEGFARRYVEGIPAALEKAGVSAIEESVTRTAILVGNPKHAKAVASVRVTVGHLLARVGNGRMEPED
ncbi:MAG: hypothetical protein QOF13_1381 [Solirubrobacterales bacterium]|nr:hypothetical protein [Solirubrobacterales bacterium]